MKRKIIFLSLLLGLSLAVLFWPNASEEEKETSVPAITNQSNDPLISAFNQSQAELEELQIKGWVKVNNQFETVENLKKIMKVIDDNTNIPFGDLELRVDESEVFNGLVLNGWIDEYYVNYYIQSTKPTQDVDKAETYVLLTLQKTEGVDDEYKETLAELKKALLALEPELDPQVSAVMIGKIEEGLDAQTRSERLNELFEFLEAEELDGTYYSVATDNLTSVVGYTPLIEDTLVIEGEEININMALRHNFLDDVSYIYLGTPIISTEY